MRKSWTIEEKQLIQLHYPDNRTEDIVRFFDGRTARVISQHAAVIGVKKSEDFFKSSASGRISGKNDIGINTRFQNFQPGWNKGKKQSDYMTAEQIERTKGTRFKSGQDPHNTVPIGTERISKDGYIEIKVRHVKNGGKNDNFEFKHRVIYEDYFGEIPKGFKVYFIDGDKRNFEPWNLGIETHAENLEKNTMSDSSIVKRFMGIKEPELVGKIINEIPAVIELKRNVIKLNQKIKKDAKRIT